MTTSRDVIPQIPKLYLIINNISKQSNVRSLLLASTAFGIETIFIAGQRKFNFDSSDPNNKDLPPSIRRLIKNKQISIRQFDKLKHCVDYIHFLGGIEIVGVEIDDSSRNVEVSNECFKGDTAIMMGNEGQGMNKNQMNVCDRLIKISQYGHGTASLNVSVAASIVLHRFHHWALSASSSPNE